MGKNRDTQFAVFADNVCRDLAEKGILKWNEPWDDAKQIIARRAYDLVEQDKHFCSLECLTNWTSLQTVDSRKIDDSDFFGIEGEMSDVIIAHMKEKGWNAEFKTMKDLDGRRWKQFQAVKDDGCKIRIDAIFFKGMTSQQIFECIDSYVDKCARS